MAFDISNFEVPDLRQLDAESVQQVLDKVIAQLQELNPELDLKRGVFHDTVAYYHAILEAATRTNLERYQSARSLLRIEQDPTLADDAVVDEVLSNWGVRRREGTKARGFVTIELESALSVNVPVNYRFQANGKEYLALDSFTSQITQDQVIDTTDRLLQPLSNGNFAFTIEVEAAEIGSDFKLNAGDLVLPVRSITGYVTSYATSSFEDGLNTETNAELLLKLQDGIAAKALSSRANMRALIATNENFLSVTNQSIVGYGDPEMLRDKHTIFPISYGGRVDWYIRGQSQLSRTTINVTAKLLSISGATSNWQIYLPASTFPGFYEVSRIRRSNDPILNSGFEIVEDQRGLDLSGDGFIPDLQNNQEGAYSAFQTSLITFTDSVSSVSSLVVGQTAEYTIEISGVPHISEIQAYVSSRAIRNYASDVLVKAPIPCFVAATLTINLDATTEVPDVDAIKQAVVDEINLVGFIGRLDGSKLIDRVHGFLRDNSSVTELRLVGRIRYPDGSFKYLTSLEALEIPASYDKMVSEKTVQFFAEVSDISINIQTSIPTAM